MTGQYSRKVIAFIGCGLSATLAAVHLARSLSEPADILLFEKSGQFSRGVAYSTDSPEHLLNVPASRMSAFAAEPEHLLEWAHQRQLSLEAGTFLSRKIYGDYLDDLLNQQIRENASNSSFERIAGEVIDIDCRGNHLQRSVILKDGRDFPVDVVVLAIGNAPATPPSLPVSTFYQSERFLHDPWNTQDLNKIGESDPVLILGTGLTMIDKVMELKSRGHRGTIMSLSRRGLLPQVHDLSCQPMTIEPEFQRLTTARSLLRLVRCREGVNWRCVIDGLRPHSQRLWQSLSLYEKKRFLRHLTPYWEVHRHRMAPAVWEKMETLLASGQLQIRAGRIQQYFQQDQQVEVTFIPKGRQTLETFTASYVLNCSGSGRNFNLRQEPLLRNLTEQKLLSLDPLGLGFYATPRGEIIHADDTVSHWLYTLGPTLKGILWESTAVPEIRLQAAALAQRIIQGFDRNLRARDAEESLSGYS